MRHFILLYCIFHLEISKITTNIDGVTLDKEWPVPINYFVKFTVNKEFTDKSVLVLELLNIKKVRKFLKISSPQYVDIVTDYYTIKKGIEKTGTSAFSIGMLFLKKSHDATLIFRWFQNGILESDDETLLNSKENIIYSSRISLTEKWKIKITLEIAELEKDGFLYQDERYFQHGKTAKITCSAFDGLPKSRVIVTGISSSRLTKTAYDEALNTWIGYMTLSINDHNTNISCHVDGTNDVQTIQIKVNHQPTLLILEPDYTGFIRNGTKIKCIPFDGYPIPLIKWDFISIMGNHSNTNKSPYQIKGDEVSFSKDISVGTQLEFNCTSIYTNPISNDMTFLKKTFKFEIGEPSNNIEYKTVTNESAIVTDVVNIRFEKLNKAAIGAVVAALVIMVIVVTIVVMLCRSKPKHANSSVQRQEGSPKYAGSLLAGSKSALHNQMKSHNGANSSIVAIAESNVNSDQNEFNYDDMPRGRRPIKVVDEPVVYSTIVGTMQPKSRPSLGLGPIDRV